MFVRLRWIIVSTLLLVVILVMVGAVQAVVVNGFLQLERQSLEKDVRRAMTAFWLEVDKLETRVSDWASWDATYQFIVDRNAAYMRDTLIDEAIANTDINFILYINQAGSIVYRKALDLTTRKQVGFPHSFAVHIANESSPLFDLPTAESHTSGILTLPEGYLMVAARPITPSDRNAGPIRGTLIMGRFIDDALVHMLTSTTYLPIDLIPIHDPRIPASVKLSAQQPIDMYEVDDLFINGYGLISDLYGEPALAARVRVSRDVYMQGRATLLQLFTGIVVVAVVSAAFITHLNTRRNQLHRRNAELERRVEARTHELREALAAKTQILANVSHDARTPLNVITLNVQLLRRCDNLDPKAQSRLDNIVLSVRQLLGFMDNLIAEAQSSELLPLNEFAFPPETLLENVIQPLRSMAEVKALSIETYIDPALPNLLYGDLKRLEQVVSNLFSNAIKFTSNGGVTVRLLRVDNIHWAIEVSDTGRGIASEHQSAIFRPFWQVDGSITRDINRGVGLGLTIVQQLTTRMGGQVRVKSVLGVGTTFTVTLPLNETESETNAERVVG